VNDGEHKKYILTSIARKWKDGKSRIFKKFYKWDLTLEENLRNYPRSIDPDNWACFVRYRRKKETMVILLMRGETMRLSNCLSSFYLIQMHFSYACINFLISFLINPGEGTEKCSKSGKAKDESFTRN
jgi:hypothetical protein